MKIFGQFLTGSRSPTGLLPISECSKSQCTSSQNATVDNCYPRDGYTRAMIYRSWNTSCPPYTPDFANTKTYVWDYSGNWYWGSTVILRCLPGFLIPAAYQNVSNI